jgi:hypothetical protein
MQRAVHDWLSRVLSEGGAGPDAARLADRIAPLFEDALKASALDMLRQCSVAQFGEMDDTEVREWTVSVNDAIAAAMRRLENKRQLS